MSCNKLRHKDILELLGDGRNSDLSDFSDEEDIHFQSEEFNRFIENFDFDLLSGDDFIPTQDLQDDDDFIPTQDLQDDDDFILTQDIDEHDNVIDVVPDSITYPFENQNDFMPAFVDKISIKWKKQPFVPSKFSLEELKERHFPEEIPTPLDYFMKYFPDNEEMKIFVGVHLLMGVFGLPRIRMYWEQKSRINIVADNITRNRFFELRSNFHIMDNNDIPLNNKDRFVKEMIKNYQKWVVSSFEVSSNMHNSIIGLIKWPEIVKCYNQSMGGVNKHDQLVSFFRTFIKSRKWTLRMITHAFDMACVNSWLEYKLDCKHIGIYKTMNLLHFKERLGETLILVGKTFVKKRDRPSNSPSPLSTPVRKRVRDIDQRPCEEVRFDHIDHLPTNDNSNYPVRCKNEGCKLRSPVKCTKCGVHLCYTKRNECFRLYHIK
ncbi:unnamed protein product [Macrosiphum euphorbiae]|uniref:PiggyBac transposable element-derived protein domain-containing protein n=1 Tax=Macrosiphum euphorbiae TaxID=13131 RepID=A0AAV0XZ90_9HEMI|nr:unnamed protein product [Macrosiphum euphorbiae]